MIRLQNVSKTFGINRALHPITLEIPEKRTTVLIGPSGCGKSTILRIIIGLIRPDQGSVDVEGEVIGNENLNRLRHKMGYVIQEGGLFPHLTAK